MGAVSKRAADAAGFLVGRLGRPAIGIVLGSGFAGLAGALGGRETIPAAEIPGWPAGSVDGHPCRVACASLENSVVWFIVGRPHLHEGLPVGRVVLPVETIAAAGARSVLLTTAAGGLGEDDRPGDFAVIADHLNLTGADPLRAIPPGSRDPSFLDLHDAYDPVWRRSWLEAAPAGLRVREGILAALAGPCYETPAEVRMLRALGADLVSMSLVPETIFARYLGLRVAGLACVANRGAGMDGGRGIDHARVLEVVERAAGLATDWVREGIEAVLRR